MMSIKFNNKELIIAVENLKSGDKEAFEIIYKLTYKKVYFFSLSITNDSELTKDIVQEIYINVFKNIRSLKDTKLFIAWLNKITYNTTIKELSKIAKKPVNIDEEEIQKKLVDEINPMIKCIEDENTKEIMKNILTLKENYRTVIILKYFNNYKIKDIAKILDCPEGTVKSRLNAAKNELKEKLYKNNSKIILLLGLGVILSSTLEKTANAAVNEFSLRDKEKNSDINKLKKLILNSVLLTVFLGGTIFIIILNNITIESKEKNVLVEYNDSFTNKDLEVNIKIENLGKKDNIKIISNNNEEIIFKRLTKDKFSVFFESNGIYKIVINDRVIKTININNIDKEAPKIIDNTDNGKILGIDLEDNLSGIDYDKLEVISQENAIIDLINIDEENNKIFIEAIKGIKYLKIFDRAGNSSIYKIDIEKN